MPVIDTPFSVDIAAHGFEDWSQVFSEGVAPGSTRTLDITLEREGVVAKEGRNRLPAPEIVFPLNGAKLYGFPRTTRIQWSPVPGANYYVIDVEGCDGGELGCGRSFPLEGWRMPPAYGITGTNYVFDFLGNQPGRYRIWAVDAEGTPGIKTPWIVFQYP